jgi:predicted cobalt transporter CbtA
MKVSRFRMAFQLIALALIFCVANVYVMAGPLKTNTDPKATDKSKVTEPAAEKDAAATSDSETAAPQAASERMPLTAGTKTVLGRIFSKKGVETRLASSSSFVNVKASAGDSFKAPRKALARPDDTDDDSDDDNGRRNMWIVAGVIAAVVIVAVIGLRADRSRESVQD